MLKNLVEKMAQKTFESDTVQRSWQVHAKALAPLLDHVFEHSWAARVRLTGALNTLTRKEPLQAMKQLMELEQKCCKTDNDHAVCFILLGLCFEMDGAPIEMYTCFERAEEYGHSYYLPHLKAAKASFDEGMYQMAAEHYMKAAVFLEQSKGEQTPAALPVAYAGCAGCHVMMHRLKEAEALLEAARKAAPDARGIAVMEALYHAAKQEPDETNASLSLARRQGLLPDDTEAMVTAVLGGTHPHFFTQPINEEQIPRFWQWVEEQLPALQQHTAKGNIEKLFRLLQEQLLTIFPEGLGKADCVLEKTEDGLHLIFFHGHSRTLEHGYQKMLEACPEPLRRKLSLKVEA